MKTKGKTRPTGGGGTVEWVTLAVKRSHFQGRENEGDVDEVFRLRFADVATDGRMKKATEVENLIWAGQDQLM